MTTGDRWLVAAAVITAIMALALPASARWPAGSTRRLAAHAETVQAAALAYDVDAGLLGAILAHETGCRSVSGGRGGGMHGVGQINAAVWLPLLSEQGIAEVDSDLLEAEAGIYAAAFVLSVIHDTHGGWAVWRRVCAYGAGGAKSKRFVESCDYSTAVLLNVDRARLVLAVGRAVGDRFGGAS